MTPQDLVISLVSFVGIVIIFYGPWQEACTDLIRQPLFEQRDKLFELGAAGNIAFDHAAYVGLRASLNGLIRYAHLVSFPRLIFHIINGSISDTPQSKVTALINGVEDPVVRRQMLSIYRSAGRALVKVILLKSPSLWFVLLLALPLISILRLVGISSLMWRVFLGTSLSHIQADAEFSDLVGLTT